VPLAQWDTVRNGLLSITATTQRAEVPKQLSSGAFGQRMESKRKAERQAQQMRTYGVGGCRSAPVVAVPDSEADKLTLRPAKLI